MPKVEKSRRVVYAEERSGVRWPQVTLAVAGWVLMIGSGAAMAIPGLDGLACLIPVGFFLELFAIMYLNNAMAVGIRVYGDGIAIGGMRGRDRRLRRGTWPPKKLTVGAQARAVFTVPWEAVDGLCVVTGRAEIKRVRRDLRQYRMSTGLHRTPLGVLDIAAVFAKALLVVSLDPSRAASDPPELRTQYSEYSYTSPVPSRTWLVPTRHPAALHDVLKQLPQAPRVFDHLPPTSVIQFEVDPGASWREPSAQLRYREDRCGLRWPLLIASIALSVVGALALLFFVAAAILAPIGWVLVLLIVLFLIWAYRWLHVSVRGWRVGIQVDDEQIQIGGLRGAERRRLSQRRSARDEDAFVEPKGVFTWRWRSGAESLYLITDRRELREFARRHHIERGSGQVSRGFLAVPRMRAALVIATTPSIGMNAFKPQVWLVPTRRPDDLRAALAAVPGAPPVQEGPPPAVASA